MANIHAHEEISGEQPKNRVGALEDMGTKRFLHIAQPNHSRNLRNSGLRPAQNVLVVLVLPREASEKMSMMSFECVLIRQISRPLYTWYGQK